MDPLEGLSLENDTTIAIIEECLLRNYNVWHFLPKDVSYINGEVVASSKIILELNRNIQPSFKTSDSISKNLKELDLIFLRQDPPFDMSYITSTFLLEYIEDEVKIINKPSEVRNAPEKLFLNRWRDLTPETIITKNISEINSFRKKHKKFNIEEIKSREGDEKRFLINAKTSDKILIFGSNGHIYSLQVNLLPSGRTNGEPIRLLTDLPNQIEIVNVIVFESNLSSLVTSNIGDGFIIKHEDMLAQTRSGKKIINLKTGIIANCLKNIKGDSIATIGTNRKLLIFKINELPELNKGKGVRLQKYKNAYLSDITSFDSEIGLVWFDKSGRKNVLSNFEDWVGKRAQSGKIAPKGFPRNNKFNLN